MSLLVIHPPYFSVESLRRLFAQSGCSMTGCPSLSEGLKLLERHRFKAVFLVYPGNHEQTLDAHTRLRPFAIPTFVITKRQSGLERVQALQQGVKNYFIEPFSYTQVVRDAVEVVYGLERLPETHTFNDVTIDYLARTVVIKDLELFLSRTQFLLLSLFVKHPRQVFSRVQIWEHVWGYAEYPLTNTIDAHIRRLRRRLPSEVASRIEAVHGVGYRYVSAKAIAATPEA